LKFDNINKIKIYFNNKFSDFVYENIIFIDNYQTKFESRTVNIYIYDQFIIKEIGIEYIEEYFYAIKSKCSLYYKCQVLSKFNKIYMYQEKTDKTLYQLIISKKLIINQILSCIELFINFIESNIFYGDIRPINIGFVKEYACLIDFRNSTDNNECLKYSYEKYYNSGNKNDNIAILINLNLLFYYFLNYITHNCDYNFLLKILNVKDFENSNKDKDRIISFKEILLQFRDKTSQKLFLNIIKINSNINTYFLWYENIINMFIEYDKLFEIIKQ